MHQAVTFPVHCSATWGCFYLTTAVNKCKYTCKCHSLTVKFPFPVFPDQPSKMAANEVSSGRQLSDKCLPEYISMAMKTKEFKRWRSWKGHSSAQLERERKRKVWINVNVCLPHIPMAIRAVVQSGFFLYKGWLLWFLQLPSGEGLSGDNVSL